MKLSPFDVVVVPFPYADRLSEKRRPALVVSNPTLPAELGRVWLAMITSAPADSFGDHAIGHLDAAGLPSRSTLRASKIATVDADRIVRVIGRLSAEDEQGARAALARCAAFV